MSTSESLAKRFLRNEWSKLTANERRVVDAVLQRETLSRNANLELHERRTLGQRVADRVAVFGGSWTFILLFGGFLVSWVLINAVVLATRPFDPYPFIFLNLILSMLAAVQAPIIMMSQNRQAAKDRDHAEHDYAVNLKAELEIMGLHEKLDEMRTEQITWLLASQREQLEMLGRLVAGRG